MKSRIYLGAAAIAAMLAPLLAAQQFQINLDQLAAKASNTVDLALSGATLQLAARFLDSKDPDEAKVKKLIAGLQGIYIKSFEFKRGGEWTSADFDRLRNQLRAPEWSRIVGIKSDEGEISEIYLRMENQKFTGVAVLYTEPREVTVVNIVGPIDLESLAELGGHFGVPRLNIPKAERSK